MRSSARRKPRQVRWMAVSSGREPTDCSAASAKRSCAIAWFFPPIRYACAEYGLLRRPTYRHRSRSVARSVATRKANLELEMRRLGLLSPATLALLLGGLLTGLGTTKLQHEINLNANGLRAPGKVVDLVARPGSGVGASAVLEVVPPDAPPFRVQVSRPSSLYDRDKGSTLDLVCFELRPEAKSCEVDTFADRWLTPVLLLVVGLSVLAWGALRISGRRSDAR
jgi:hypothetical protein